MANKLVVPIAGLHCRACEILVEDHSKKLKNIKEITVNHQKGLAEIIFKNEEPSLKEIAHELAKLVYSLGTENVTIKKPKQNFSYWFSIMAAIIIVYWLLGRSHFLEFSGLIQGGF